MSMWGEGERGVSAWGDRNEAWVNWEMGWDGLSQDGRTEEGKVKEDLPNESTFMFCRNP